MPEEKQVKVATKKLLDALVQYRRLRDIPYRGNHKGMKACRHSDMMILFALKQVELTFPDGISISELSRKLNLKSPTVTPAVYHLEKMNLVERSTDSRDRRVVRIRLTESGRTYLQSHKGRYTAHIEDLVRHLGIEKSLTLAELLDEVYNYERQRIDQK